MRTSTTKNIKSKFLSIAFFLIIWGLAAYIVNNKILLPGPGQVLLELAGLLTRGDFWTALINSISRILLGLILGIFLGLALAILVYSFPLLESLIGLPVDLIKSTPLASITVLLLIWVNSNRLASFIVALVVLPNIYHSSLSALLRTDRKLLEMAHVFRVSRIKKIRFIYLDQLRDFLLPSIISSTGLAWKSGISAEVLGMVSNSLGEKIYYSKLYLNTAELFAWTLVIVLISKLFQIIINSLIGREADG